MPPFLESLGLAFPLFQAPMAGTSTPALATAVSEAGGLGALGLGAATPEAAAKAMAEVKARTDRPFHVNFFSHEPSAADPARDAAWIARAAPLFEGFGAAPPETLNEIYLSFRADDAMLKAVLEARPALVSFHFGLPRPDQIAALKAAGLRLAASATSLAEAEAVHGAGFDAVIAQGWEAGGHRGFFNPSAPDERLSTEALTRRLAALPLPVIAAGGLMDGADIARALEWGASAAQLGTAFIATNESAADPAHRARLMDGGTVMTAAISGRPARCLTNSFTAWAEAIPSPQIAAYPRAYDLGKALNAAAKSAGETGFGAQWAGMEAARARALPAAELMALLKAEFEAA